MAGMSREGEKEADKTAEGKVKADSKRESLPEPVC
jgi:hypothetical protein